MSDLESDSEKDVITEAREALFEEFSASVTDMDIAREMVRYDDEEMTFEQMEDIMFDDFTRLVNIIGEDDSTTE